MLVVTGRVAIKPEKRELALEATTKMAVASRAESGCISYGFYSFLEEPNVFFAFEEWESPEALALHFQTDHMKEFQKVLPEIIAGQPDIKSYVIQSVGPLRI
jgi:quinol monooxygenase YgiN